MSETFASGATFTPAGYQGPGTAGDQQGDAVSPVIAALRAENAELRRLCDIAEQSRADLAAQLERFGQPAGNGEEAAGLVTANEELGEALTEARAVVAEMLDVFAQFPGDFSEECEDWRQRAGLDGDEPDEDVPLKPVVFVFDINEGIQGWFHELANEVYAMSGERVVITHIDAEMSDVMIAVADREVGVDEALAIWESDGDFSDEDDDE